MTYQERRPLRDPIGKKNALKQPFGVNKGKISETQVRCTDFNPAQYAWGPSVIFKR